MVTTLRLSDLLPGAYVRMMQLFVSKKSAPALYDPEWEIFFSNKTQSRKLSKNSAIKSVQHTLRLWCAAKCKAVRSTHPCQMRSAYALFLLALSLYLHCHIKDGDLTSVLILCIILGLVTHSSLACCVDLLINELIRWFLVNCVSCIRFSRNRWRCGRNLQLCKPNTLRVHQYGENQRRYYY